MDTNGKINLWKLIYLLSKKIFWNKYAIIGIVFIIWMTFFDIHSLLNHNDLSNQINEYKKEKMIVEKKLNESKTKYKSLKENREEREKYARENYFMKRDNEDIIIVTYENDSLNIK